MGLVFSTMQAHSLFLKRSKCSFGALSITYLGPVISTNGVAMDSDKVAMVTSWLMPSVGCARLPRAHGLLPQVYPRHWLHHNTPHAPPVEGGVRLNSGGRQGLHYPQAGTLIGAGPADA